MRVLCSFVGGAGHLVPQLPLLRGLADAGHDLTLVGRASGVAGAPAGLFRRVVARPDARTRVRTEITPLAPVDREAEVDVVAQYFAGDAARASAAAVGAAFDAHDVVVCDELDFGAMAAGALAGVPVVVVAVIASGALVRPERVGRSLETLGHELGLGRAIGHQGGLFVVPFAPAMRDPRFPTPADAVWMNPGAPRPTGRDAAQPSIIATLGTEFNTESGDLFDRIIGALEGIDVPSVVAIGRDLDPERFRHGEGQKKTVEMAGECRIGPVRIRQFVDLDAVLPHADLVVHHGGSGVFLRSVLAGVPQLVLPMGADQPFTGDTVERTGVGRVLDAVTADAGRIRDQARELLGDAAMKDRVEHLRDAVRALPGPESAVARVEAFAVSG
ncbi:glycosyltransferase [Herbiconiux solani]|uniref:glycosyltransferase n=1 Tax=Herbiconiux solani TaxID=661329 RepID=UPI0012EE5956|nr:nucleotide disphospho-sugar-binding domain-containing protein [Herbiconiux solani]